MVITENYDLEKTVLAGVNCFAVPIEVFVPSEGEVQITSYSVCVEKARQWEELFCDDILSEESLVWLENELSALVEKLGYRRVFNENEIMLEYVFTPDMHMPKCKDSIKVHRISSNAVLAELCEASGCDIEIADDGEDVIFAVVEGGLLRAYAGMNDIYYEDDSVEISVETAPDCRRKGYGAACVTELVKYLTGKGKTVRYKCSSQNLPSSALCEKCGFEIEGTRYSFVCEKI